MSSPGEPSNRPRAGQNRPNRRPYALNRPASLGWLERWVLPVALAATVLTTLFGVGAVHPPLLLAASLPALLAAAWLAARGRLPRRWFSSPGGVLLALSAYSIMQCVPLPLALVRWLSPQTASVWVRAVLPWDGEVRAYVPLSLDPGATWLEALKWSLYAAVFLASARVSAVRGTRVVLALVFWAAVAACLTLLVHGAIGTTKLYGLYEPQFAVSRWGLGPLLNPNNLASYFNLGTFCALALLGSDRARHTPFVAAGIAVLVAGTCMLGSRGGVAALVIASAALIVVGFFTVGRPRNPSPGPRRWPTIGVAAAGSAALLAVGGSSRTLSGLAREDWEKVRMLTHVADLVRDHIWVGVGRGAFDSAYAAYANPPGNTRYQFAENFVAQWMSGWGAPVALFALAAIAISLRPALRKARDRWSTQCALAGVFAVLAQNLIDLGLEVPAVAVALSAVLGCCWSSSRARSLRSGAAQRRTDGSTLRRGRALASAAVIAFAIVPWVQALRVGLSGVDAERRSTLQQFRQLALDSEPSVAAFIDSLKGRILRHPAEPYFYLVGAYAAWQAGSPPLRWIGRALERSGGSSRAHLLLARVLLDSEHVEQGFLSLRRAVEAEPALARVCARVALSTTRSRASLERAVPEGAPGAPMLVELSNGLARDEAPELKVGLLREALRRAPSNRQALTARAEDLTSKLGGVGVSGTAKGECLRAPKVCLHELADVLARLDVASSSDGTDVALHARWLVLNSRDAEADAYLGRKCPSTTSPSACWRLRTLVASGYADSRTLVQRADSYVSIACVSPENCAAAAKFAASLLAKRRNHLAAARYLERAARQLGTSRLWLETARQYELSGDGYSAERATRSARVIGAAPADADGAGPHP